MRVAIVHERFTELGGAERVVEELHRIWPDAPIYAALVDPAAVPPGLHDADVRPSRLQRAYRGGARYAHLLPFLPGAIAHFDLSGFDVVVTSHFAFANRVRPPPGVPVISYTYSPARWMWDARMRRGEPGGMIGRAGLALFSATQRHADRAAAARARGIIAISRTVCDRIDRWWHCRATVVNPPVDVEWFTPDPTVVREDFFLSVGRLVPYKRPSVAVAAARRAGVPLVVVGDGRERHAVEEAAGPGIEVLGRVDNAIVRDLYRRCRALLFPGEEDFGIVPVEAQACGAPVIALDAGGAAETVVEGVTGTLYVPAGDDVVSLAAAIERFDPSHFQPTAIRTNAERFSAARFRSRWVETVGEMLGESPV